MKILVSAASKHGSTAAIAEAIGGVLSSAGIETDVRPPEEVTSVASYDGIVLGSGVYAGHWLTPAKELVEREAAALASVPVWLFSSGPIGDPPKPDEEPVDVAQLHKVAKALYEVILDGLEFGARGLPTAADREWIRGAIAMPIQEAAGVALHVLGWRLTQALERAPDGWMDRFESSHRGDELGWE